MYYPTFGSSKKNKLEIRPLPGLPVVKDLIVDMTQFVDQYKKIRPYLISDKEDNGKEIPQTIEDRDKLDGLYMNAFYVAVAQLHVLRFGGILISF